ncbi:hypothetical protein B296_00016309, partial [Ensete ventricosum]
SSGRAKGGGAASSAPSAPMSAPSPTRLITSLHSFPSLQFPVCLFTPGVGLLSQIVIKHNLVKKELEHIFSGADSMKFAPKTAGE